MPDRIADELAALRETLAEVGIDPDASGAGADAIRQMLAERTDHLGEIATAMRAVATAARAREELLGEREVAMPSDTDIEAAQQAVITCAGTVDEQAAIDRLTDLLTQKRDAQKAFELGEKAASDSLDTAARDLRMPGVGASSPAALNQLMGVLSSLSRMGAGAPGGMPGAEEAAAGAPTAFAPEGADPTGVLASHLEDHDRGRGRARHPRLPFDVTGVGEGMGQTHTAGAVPSAPQQMPTLSGVVTSGDVTGRGAPGFAPAAGGALPGGGSGGGGAGVPPMMPPMAGAGGAGAAQGKKDKKTTIVNDDPGFTGADIESEIATSGVIGRGERQRRRTGGIA